MKSAAKLWSESHPLNGEDTASLYLRNRGLKLSDFPDSLRFIESLESWRAETDANGRTIWNSEGVFPAMLARVDDARGNLVTLHRTYLTREGEKAPIDSAKKIMKAPYAGATKGAAIRLCEPSSVLALAEGIETALAYHALTNLPTWACLTANGVESVLVPESVETIYICVDLDLSGRGKDAAERLAARLLAEGRMVYKAIPPGGIPSGTKSVDWLDYLIRRLNEYKTERQKQTIVRIDS